MGRIPEDFQSKLLRAYLPKREIEVTGNHFYLRKKGRRPTYVVTKIVQQNKKRSFLYFTSTLDEEVAKRASRRMCELINEEIRRRDTK